MYKVDLALNNLRWSICHKTGSISLDLIGSGSNGNEGVIHTVRSSRRGDSPTNSVKCHTQDS